MRFLLQNVVSTLAISIACDRSSAPGVPPPPIDFIGPAIEARHPPAPRRTYRLTGNCKTTVMTPSRTPKAAIAVAQMAAVTGISDAGPSCG